MSDRIKYILPDGFCKECQCKPCQCKHFKNKRKNGASKCLSCGTELLIKGGYSGTDLCGPCATGEAETLNEI